jgi:hypothetical protein
VQAGAGVGGKPKLGGVIGEHTQHRFAGVADDGGRVRLAQRKSRSGRSLAGLAC